MPRRAKEEISKSMKKTLETKGEDELIELSHRYDLLFVNGEYFKEVSKDGKLFWKKVPMEKVEPFEKKSNEIAEKVLEHLDRKKVLIEALRKIHPKDVNKLHRMLFEDKKKYTIKTREGHCIDMKIGNFILPIIDIL